MSSFTGQKDRDAKLDYSIDWAPWLDNDTIVTSTLVVDPSAGPTPLVIYSGANTDTLVTFWLSGGAANTTYTITNHIVTAAGREDDRSITFSLVER